MSARSLVLWAFLFVTFGITQTVDANSPFSDCTSRTDIRAIITIPQEARPAIDGERLSEGAEIAAYTDDGICAGHAVWTGENTAIVLWGNDSQTEEKDGFNPGDAISFRIWDPITDQVYEGEEVSIAFNRERSFFMTESTFQEGGIYVLSGLHVGEELGETEIENAYPNPTTAGANVRISLAEPDHVRVRVYDLLGRLVTTVLDEELPMGHYNFYWDGADSRGGAVSSGTYFLRLETSHGADTRSITVVR